MVDVLDRTGSTKLEDCARLCAVHDHGLPYRVALWTQRGRVLWCVHGTVISLRDILLAVSRPVASGVLAGVAFGVRLMYGQFFSPLPRLVLESSALFVTMFGVLLFAAGQKSLYLDILRGLWSSSVARGGEAEVSPGLQRQNV